MSRKNTPLLLHQQQRKDSLSISRRSTRFSCNKVRSVVGAVYLVLFLGTAGPVILLGLLQLQQTSQTLYNIVVTEDADVATDGENYDASSSPVFQVDRMAKHVLEHPNARDAFGVVLVAGWPFPQYLQKSYQNFINEVVQRCFVDDDDNKDTATATTLYTHPSSAMHITVATLHANSKQRPGQRLPENEQTDILEMWHRIVQDASATCPHWPRRNLEFDLVSAKLDPKAGILLWEETTGGLDQIRNCIRDATAAAVAATNRMTKPQQRRRQMSRTLSIPPIVHSTFLRFAQKPATPYARVQQCMRTLLLRTHFSESHLVASQIHLVVERQAFMDIDKDHDVLETFDFR